MESKSDRTEDENKWEQQSADERAAEQTPASSATTSPRRGLRARKAGRPKSGAPAPVDINGSHAPIPRTSGRVLRDRSTRAVPAWLKDTKSDDEDEASPLPCATKRRKVSYSRRKKPTEAAGSSEHAGEDGGVDGLSTKDSGDVEKPTSMAQGPSSASPPGPQSRGRAPRAARGTARPVCKSEPGTEDAAAMERQVKVKERNPSASKKKKKEEEEETGEDVYDEDLPGEKGLPFEDDPCDLNYQPQAQSEEEEALSSDEDLPFRDDLNDQSYNPKTERDVPKRRPAPRQERREKGTARDSEGEAADIKVEGAENPDPVEEESKPEEKPREDPDGPRKRGRRRKDDKTPRLPKRRKKPPVQYVRCEMEGCGTVLAHPRYLQHHIKYQHLLKKKYVCPHPTCGRLFRLQKQLLRHAKHHTDQRDYICEFCARAFKSSHNLAVHRMIHTGEKPLQCEICGFTCRQKASLNWHMKKHDADATYQFSCSICGKKFEKKDCVVAHKAKSHPEVLIAEALAANAGALLTTPASLLELQGGQVQTEVTALEVAQATGQHVSPQVSQASQQVSQVSQQVGHQVVLLGQDQSIHTMQVPVTIALSPVDPPSPDSRQQAHQLQLQVPLHFVQAAPHSHSQQQQQQQPQIQQLTLHSGSMVTQPQIQQLTLHSGSMVTQPQIQQLTLHSGSMVTQHQGQQHHQQGQTEVLHMTFQPVSQAQTHIQQIPILANSQQLHTLQTASSSSPLLSTSQAQHTTVANGDGYVLDTSVLASSSSSANGLHQQAEAVEDGDVVWEQAGGSLIDGSEVQQVII